MGQVQFGEYKEEKHQREGKRSRLVIVALESFGCEHGLGWVCVPILSWDTKILPYLLLPSIPFHTTFASTGGEGSSTDTPS